MVILLTVYFTRLTRPSNNYNNINTLVKGAVPLTKFIKFKQCELTPPQRLLCVAGGLGRGKKTAPGGTMGRGERKRPPRTFLLFLLGYQAGACAEERGATAIFPLEGNDGAVVRALASFTLDFTPPCGAGSNPGVDDICGC